MLVSRRELLDLAVRAAALPGAARFFAAWFSTASDYQPQFFDAEDFAALQAFTEILIPTDDTPGAREARCAQFIDFVLHAATGIQPELQQQWRDALGALRAAGFHAADAPGRAAIVEAMARPEHDRAATHPAYAAYRLIKQQTAFAFFTSRAGMIETLDYRGNSFNATFPACTHPEHHTLHGSGV